MEIVVLAAGQSKRMGAGNNKLLCNLCGFPVINYVIELAKSLNPNSISVVLPDNSELSNLKLQEIKTVIQPEPLGTGDALKRWFESQNDSNLFSNDSDVLVLYGDTPLIEKAAIEQMIKEKEKKNADVVILGMKYPFENKYGRIIYNKNKTENNETENKHKNIVSKIEEGLINKPNSTHTYNSGIMLLNLNVVNRIAEIEKTNKEYHLTKIVEIQGIKSVCIECNWEQLIGVNTCEDLSIIENILQQKIRKKMMNDGARLIDPQTTFFSFDTKIDSGTIVHPHVVFGVNVIIKNGCTIKPFSYIDDTIIEPGSIVGPFAYIHNGCVLNCNTHIGAFAEAKNSIFHSKSKMKHHGYVGDSEIGAETNIGAGTVFCNYDGKNKNKSIVGSKVFIGSNSTLISPITVGNEAIIGGGSTITNDIQNNALTIGRQRQRNIESGAIRYRKLKQQ